MKNQAPGSIDLDAYFQRIGYQGDRTPILKTLQATHPKPSFNSTRRYTSSNLLQLEHLTIPLKNLELQLV